MRIVFGAPSPPSNDVYTRKRPEEMDEEYKRQQFSIYYFVKSALVPPCLSTVIGGQLM
jgi:hypothetical protein